jgi:hypothetical protein
MASTFETILGGLGTGFAKGFEEASSPAAVLGRRRLAAQKRQAIISERKVNMESAQAVMGLFKPGQGSQWRKIQANILAEYMGLDKGSLDNLVNIANALDDEKLKQVEHVIETLIGKGLKNGNSPSTTIKSLATMKPETMLKFIAAIQKNITREATGAAVRETETPKGPDLGAASNVLLRQGLLDPAKRLGEIGTGRIEAMQKRQTLQAGTPAGLATAATIKLGVATAAEARAEGRDLDKEQRALFRTMMAEVRAHRREIEKEDRAAARQDEDLRTGVKIRPAANVRTFVNTDGSKATPVNMSDPVAVKKAVDAGKIPVNVTLAQLTELNPSLKAKLRARALQAAAGVNQITSVLFKLKDLPAGVTGVRAKIALGMGGLVEQLGDALSQVGWGDFISQAITGADQETLQAFTTDSVQVIAANIDVLTGERGARVSEFEWQRAKQAGRILNAAASPQQIRGALVSMLSAKMHSIDRIAFETDGKFLFDVTSKAARAKTGADLRASLGLSKDDVAALIVEMGSNQMLLSRAIYHDNFK